MTDASMKVNLPKFLWAIKKVPHLGCIVAPKGYLPHEKKVEVLANMSRPKNAKQLRKFTCRFISDRKFRGLDYVCLQH